MEFIDFKKQVVENICQAPNLSSYLVHSNQEINGSFSSYCQIDSQRAQCPGINLSLTSHFKRQAKLFILDKKKHLNSKDSRFFQKSVQLLVNIIKSPEAAEKGIHKEMRQRNQQKIKPKVLIFGKINKSCGLQAIILSRQHDYKNKATPFLQLTIIDLSARINYRHSNVSKIEDLCACFIELRRRIKHMLLVVQRIDQIKQVLGKKSKETLQKILSSFTPFSDVAPTNPYLSLQNTLFLENGFNSTNLNTYNNSINELEASLQKIFFIKKSLLKNIASLQNPDIAFHYEQIMPFACNLVSPIIQLGRGTLNEQVSMYLPQIQHVFRKMNTDQHKIRRNRQDFSHMPACLPYTRFCWKCKIRGLIQCPTCTIIQGKTVSLCLDCYSLFHSSKIFGQEKHRISDLLVKWENVESRLGMLLQQQLQQSITPPNKLMRKQQNG